MIPIEINANIRHKQHVKYDFTLKHKSVQWNVCKRYSEFRSFRRGLLHQLRGAKACIGCHHSEDLHKMLKQEFPQKAARSSDKDTVLQERKQRFQKLVTVLVDSTTRCAFGKNCCTRQAIQGFLDIPDRFYNPNGASTRSISVFVPREKELVYGRSTWC